MGYDELFAQHLSTLVAGHDAALSRCGFDAVLVHSGVQQRKSPHDDQDWPHVTAPHFLRWVPLPRADCWVHHRPGRRPTLYRPTVDDFWHAAPPTCDESFLTHFDVVEAPLPAEVRSSTTAVLSDASAEDSAALRHELDALRAIKTPYEQRAMAEANRTAARGHRRVQRLFAGGGEDGELALHLAYLASTGQDDPSTPYKGIVAMGRHAATLHHVHYAMEPGPPETSLLVDAGAMHLGYHADVTRTVARGDQGAARAFTELIDAIDGMQRAICDEVVPGTPFEQLHDGAHHRLAEVLREVGLGRGDAEALVESGVTRAFLPHGLGHSLGLQTHDVGCRPRPPAERNPYLRNTSTVTTGQVLTIEPGCYFIEALLSPLRTGAHSALVDWAQVDRLSPFGGVRIEDDVLVTDTGHRNLTREAFAALDA